MKAVEASSDSPPRRLTGKVAWVTGAGRGLGRAIALGLARAGADVAVTSRSADELGALVDEISSSNGSALGLPGSVTDSVAMRKVVDEVQRFFGRLNILVNSAGISPSFTRAEELSDEVWQSIIEVNLTGTFVCCREAGRVMLESGGGSVVNISSVHASSGFGRLAAYAASKGGVEALTRALAVEWAQRGIRVNTVAPGYFLTALSEPVLASQRLHAAVVDRTPLARIASSQELVGAVTFLASDEASFVTGSTLYVDGGWTAS